MTSALAARAQRLLQKILRIHEPGSSTRALSSNVAKRNDEFISAKNSRDSLKS
jgi:hypothetical protein